MKYRVSLLLIILTLTLISCSNSQQPHGSNNSPPDVEVPQEIENPASIPDDVVSYPFDGEGTAFYHIEAAKTWQLAYAELLQDYKKRIVMERGDRLTFLLHDFDMDGTPELIVAGEYAGELIDVAYTLANGEILRLEHGEGVSIIGYALGARMGVTATPDNAPGLITYSIGPSAGMFGTSVLYRRIVIDGHRLVIDAHGSYYVDIGTLHELFDNFGYNEPDSDMLDSAIQEHTHYYINNNAVSQEELIHMFREGTELIRFGITEENIREIILVPP